MAYFLSPSYASAEAPQTIQYTTGMEVKGREAQVYLEFFEPLMDQLSPLELFTNIWTK